MSKKNNRKRKIECEESTISRKRKKFCHPNSTEQTAVLLNDLFEHDEILDRYVESGPQPEYLTVPSNENLILNNGHNRKGDVKIEQIPYKYIKEGLIDHSIKMNIFNGDKSHGKDIQCCSEELSKQSDIQKLHTNSTLLVPCDITEEKVGTERIKVKPLSTKCFEEQNNRMLIDCVSKNERNCNDFPNVKKDVMENQNDIEITNRKILIGPKKSESNIIFPKEINIDCSTNERLPHTAYSTEEQHPLILSTRRIDPWSVPELYLDSIEIEITVGKGSPKHKSRKGRLKKGNIEIIPLDEPPISVAKKKPFRPKRVPQVNDTSLSTTAFKQSVDNHNVKRFNIFKPYLIRPTVSLENCLPIDVVSAPFMDYHKDDVERHKLGKNSLYFNNILGNLKFNEAFLQTQNDNSFQDLLGVNIFDEVTDPTVEGCYKTEVKEEFNMCPKCLLEISPLLSSVIELNNGRMNSSYCKCNLKTFQGYKNKTCLQSTKMRENFLAKSDSFSDHCDKLSRNRFELSSLFNYNSIEDNFQLNLNILNEYTIPQSYVSYENYGNINKTPEYFENVKIDKELLQNYNYDYSMFISESFYDDQISNETLKCEESMIKMECNNLHDVILPNEKMNTDNLSATLRDKMSNSSLELNKPKISHVGHRKEEDLKAGMPNLSNSLKECNYQAKPQLSFQKKNLRSPLKCDNMVDWQLSIEKQMLLNPSQTLNETGWIALPGDPDINCRLDHDCPTVIPFQLKDSYLNSASELVSWEFKHCIMKRIKENKVKIPIKKRKYKKKLVTVSDDVINSICRPINVINSFNSLRKWNTSHRSVFSRHFGSLSNSMLQSEMLKTSEKNNQDLSHKVKPAILCETEGKNNLSDNLFCDVEKTKVSDSSPANSSLTCEIQQRKSIIKLDVSQKISKPSVEYVKKKKNSKVSNRKLAHSIFSSHVMKNRNNDIPASVCILLNRNVFVYNRNYS